MNKMVVFGLITIISLMGTVRGLTRKYIMRYMSNLSIVFIDAFISGFFMSIAALYFGGLKQLKKDLSMLNLKNGKTAQENLIELGIFDVASQSLNINNFKNRLTSIRENRDITKN